LPSSRSSSSIRASVYPMDAASRAY
jgi:hypothetical protein